jgi:hypothetical protein
MASSIDIRKVPVYYISDEGDAEERIRAMLKEYGFRTIKRSPSVPDKIKAIGVAKAHMLALETALSERKGPFLILEQDVGIRKNSFKFDVPADADAIYLGVSIWGLKDGRGQKGMISGQKTNGGFYRMLNMLTAHAVLHINHDYARFLVKHIPTFIDMGTNQDKLRAETMKYWNIYSQIDPIFYQRGKYEGFTNVRLASYMVKPLSVFYL